MRARRILELHVALLVVAGAWVTGRAAVTRQMGLEQAVLASDVVVLATVVDNPDRATLERGKPFRHQRVRVARYFQGDGPTDIVVRSPGGRYSAWIPGVGRREIEAIDGSDCRLPPVGTEVVLFLRKRGDAYAVAAATHGILPLIVDEATGRKRVRVLVDDFENLGPAGRTTAANARIELGRLANEKFMDLVEVEDLARTISRLRPRKAAKGDRP